MKTTVEGERLVETRVCHWTKDDDGVWTTGCGQPFCFIDDGPKENGFRYCYYCGKPLPRFYRAPLRETKP